jgi:hypothetical protein
MIHFHFILGLRANQLQTKYLVLVLRLLDNIQGPLDSHGHDSWSLRKATIRLDGCICACMPQQY